ncbi:MAG: hypothetical protein ACM3VS_19055 [Candidatus Dadabacteria bacterium]
MKQSNHGAERLNGKLMSILRALYSESCYLLIPSFLIVTALLMEGCQKQDSFSSEPQLPSVTSAAMMQSNPIYRYQGLPEQTTWELQQARAASSKYQNFDNAVKDGYTDINVIVPEMGYHYLRSDILDLSFDYTKPEILVYNKTAKGTMELVAVEYAVPIALSPTTAPAGFTGNADVWDRNTYFGLWLLHAWVWSYNPSGVFNSTNPMVHVD